MNFNYLMTKAGKILAKGTMFRVGKYLAKKGGKAGIGAGALLAGGFLAYNMWKERKEDKRPANKITTKKKEIVV